MDLSKLVETPPWEWPEGTTRELLAVLADERSDESDRRLAARLSAELTVMNDELVETLLDILDRGDFSDVLRSQAALSLGPVLEQADIDGFDEPGRVPISEGSFRRIKEALRKAYMDAGVPKPVRRAALEASVRAPQDWHREAVRSAYAHWDRDWRRSAVFAMRWVDGLGDLILEALESQDDEIRYEAVCAAGNWGLDDAWPHVMPILEARVADKPMLLAAIEAAASIRPKEAAVMLSGMDDLDDEEIAEAVHEALSLAEIKFE